MTLVQQVINEPRHLTSLEIDRVKSLYFGCPQDGDKLILTHIKHMHDEDIYMLCYWYYPGEFQGTRKEEWRIERDNVTIKVTAKKRGLEYIIDTQSGDIFVGRNGVRSHLGSSAHAIEFYCVHGYAFPHFFGKGHWGNGKNALELGIAVPDIAPLEKLLLHHFNGDKGLVQEYIFEKRLLGIKFNDYKIFDLEMESVYLQR